MDKDFFNQSDIHRHRMTLLVMGHLEKADLFLRHESPMGEDFVTQSDIHHHGMTLLVMGHLEKADRFLRHESPMD